jgi:hypothetical protein
MYIFNKQMINHLYKTNIRFIFTSIKYIKYEIK